MQYKYYQILLGQTCEWLLWRDGRFVEVVSKTGSTIAQNTSQNYLRHVKSVMIEKKMEDAKKGKFKGAW